MAKASTYLYNGDVRLPFLCDVGVVDLVVLEPLEVGVEVAEHDVAGQHGRLAHGHRLVLGPLDDGLVRQAL